MQRKIKLAFIGLSLAIVMLAGALGALLVTKNANFSMNIKAIGNISIWQNSACTIPYPTSTDFGQYLSPGVSNTTTIYIKSNAAPQLWVSWTISGFLKAGSNPEHWTDTGTEGTTYNFGMGFENSGMYTGTYHSMAANTVLPLVIHWEASSAAVYNAAGYSFGITISATDTSSG